MGPDVFVGLRGNVMSRWQHVLTVKPGLLSGKVSTMGKKSRVKIQKSGSAATASVSSKEMMILVSELLQSTI